MRLALVQINPTIGNLAANAQRIADFTRRARDAGAHLVAFPELALTGYPPKDLLLHEGFIEEAAAHAHALGRLHSHNITLVFGTPVSLNTRPDTHAQLANALLVYRDAALVASYHKRLLPTYDVFDEDRYFTPGARPVLIDAAGTRVGLSICEDLWRAEDAGFSHRYADSPDPVAELLRPGPAADNPSLPHAPAQLILNPSASPFVLGKGARHRDLLRKHATKHRVYVASVNQVGGNDDLLFDGHAALIAPDGRLVAAAPGFTEHLLLIDLPDPRAPLPPPIPDPLLTTPDEQHIYNALVLGVRDYLHKTGFKSALLGLSGGIDSAVTAVIAAAALGPSNLLAVTMPSRHSSPGSLSDANELAANLGVPTTNIPIEPAFNTLESSLAPAFAGRPPDITEENLQSRIRGTILMALSNKLGHLLLTTGNKSELAVGYCTLYGDMNGGLAVLSDLTKALIYRLARWINANPALLGLPASARHPVIPDASITKPPSAELRPNQTDQDTLPPYDLLDDVIRRYVELRHHPARITRDTGYPPDTVQRIVRMIDNSEYKRKQTAVGLKVTSVAFGSGRRIPIAQQWRPRADDPNR